MLLLLLLLSLLLCHALSVSVLSPPIAGFVRWCGHCILTVTWAVLVGPSKMVSHPLSVEAGGEGQHHPHCRLQCGACQLWQSGAEHVGEWEAACRCCRTCAHTLSAGGGDEKLMHVFTHSLSLSLILSPPQDVGGQEKIRPLWRHYYAGTNGLIFVVDRFFCPRCVPLLLFQLWVALMCGYVPPVMDGLCVHI